MSPFTRGGPQTERCINKSVFCSFPYHIFSKPDTSQTGDDIWSKYFWLILQLNLIFKMRSAVILLVVMIVGCALVSADKPEERWAFHPNSENLNFTLIFRLNVHSFTIIAVREQSFLIISSLFSIEFGLTIFQSRLKVPDSLLTMTRAS